VNDQTLRSSPCLRTGHNSFTGLIVKGWFCFQTEQLCSNPSYKELARVYKFLGGGVLGNENLHLFYQLLCFREYTLVCERELLEILF